MTAKGKAIQVLVAVSVTAVTYTIYSNSSGREKMPTFPQVKNTVAVKADRDKHAMSPVQKTAVYNENAIPGYCNPDENGK
jgi:hypothetical protein